MVIRNSPKLRTVILHAGIWMVLIAFPLYLMSIASELNQKFTSHLLLHVFLYAALFYLNYLVYARWFFHHRTRLRYLAVSGLTLLMVTLFFREGMEVIMHPSGERDRIMTEASYNGRPHSGQGRTDFPGDHFRPRQKPPRALSDYNFLLAGFMVSLLGLGLRYVQNIRHDEQMRKEAEKERIRSELQYLKNQISPHFFFNTLNSIYALTETRPSEARETILVLSKMMRYLLYETDKPLVSLAEETDFLRRYIELMRLRIPRRVEVSWSFPGEAT